MNPHKKAVRVPSPNDSSVQIFPIAMLTDSFIVPTSLGNIDHPCPGKYLRYSDDLIEQYGTLDFRFSWNTYDESSLRESKSVWWGDRSEARAQIVADWSQVDRKEWVAQAVQQMQKVAELSIEQKQHSNAIGAISMQAKLLGVTSRDN
jgi:hypothetical protein